MTAGEEAKRRRTGSGSGVVSGQEVTNPVGDDPVIDAVDEEDGGENTPESEAKEEFEDARPAEELTDETIELLEEIEPADVSHFGGSARVHGQNYDPLLRRAETMAAVGFFLYVCVVAVTALVGQVLLAIDPASKWPHQILYPVALLVTKADMHWRALVVLSIPLLYRLLRRLLEEFRGHKDWWEWSMPPNPPRGKGTRKGAER